MYLIDERGIVSVYLESPHLVGCELWVGTTDFFAVCTFLTTFHYRGRILVRNPRRILLGLFYWTKPELNECRCLRLDMSSLVGLLPAG